MAKMHLDFLARGKKTKLLSGVDSMFDRVG